MGPVGMRNARPRPTLVPSGWKRAQEWLGGMGVNENTIFSHFPLKTN